MKNNNVLTEKSDRRLFENLLSCIIKQDPGIPYNITFLFENNDQIQNIYEYKTFLDSEAEELKVYLIESNNIHGCKNERDKLIINKIKKSYINNALALTYSSETTNWILTYYKVRYVENKKRIERKISTSSKYSILISKNRYTELLDNSEELKKHKEFKIDKINNLFNNKNIKNKFNPEIIENTKKNIKSKTKQNPENKKIQKQKKTNPKTSINLNNKIRNETYEQLIKIVLNVFKNSTKKKTSNKTIIKRNNKIISEITKNEDYIEIKLIKPIKLKDLKDSQLDYDDIKTEFLIYIDYIEEVEIFRKILKEDN